MPKALALILLVTFSSSPVLAGAGPQTTAGLTVKPGASPGVLAAAVSQSAERWSLMVDQARIPPAKRDPEQSSWPRRHPAALGALIGAGVGAGAGYAIGQDCSSDRSGTCSSRVTTALAGAGVFAGVGAVVGLLAGCAAR